MIGSPARWVLIAVHFVCPLLFFTNLTRNPYFTQIALLNIGLLCAAALALAHQAREGRWRLPATPLALPIGAFVGVCIISWTYAYFAHAEFFRESMFWEGLRVMLFTVVNTVIPFFLATACAGDCPEEPDVPVWRWAAFVAVWALLWSFYPQMRGSAAASAHVWPQLWDPYGAFVWAGGLAWVLWLSRSGGVHAVWHVALTVGFLAAAYGVAQYFSLEFFWPKTLNPYGGRSVSTFGNPNFLSSYLVMLMPLAVVYYLHAKTRAQRALYALVILVLEASLLCSLTRSSWLGAAAAVAPLVLSRRLRRLARVDVEFHGLVATSAVLLVLFWPQSNVSGYAPSVVGRLSEMGAVFQAQSGGQPYSPLYQRLLIWLCTWTMGAENPLLGKGWGLLELFYPFYQGHFIDILDVFRPLRTHANNAHNEIIEVWAQLGIVGLGVFLWMWLVFFLSVWRSFRSGRDTAAPPAGKGKGPKGPGDEREPVWMLAAASGLLGMLVDNMLNVSLHFAVPALLFWWQAGIVMGHLSLKGGRVRELVFSNRLPAAALAVLAAGLCCWGSWYWVCQWQREVNYFMGFKFMRRGDSRRAVTYLERSFDWHHREVNAVYELGNAYARSERFEDAVRIYGEALKANAGYDEIYFNRGTILSTRLGRRDDALRDYRTSWAINPLSRQLYTNFVALLLQGPEAERKSDLTVQVLERAAHLFGEEISFLINLGAVYNMRGEHGKAAEAFARCLRARPEAGLAEQNLRATLARTGGAPPPVLKRVEEFHRLGERLKAGKFDATSLEMARRALEWFPESPQAMFYLGNMEMIHGEMDKAERLLREVIRLDPKHVSAMLNLAQTLRRRGKTSEAVSLLKRALQAQPGNRHALAELKAMGIGAPP